MTDLTDEHLKELQRDIADVDFSSTIGINRGNNSELLELKLLKFSSIKIVMREEKNHTIPHLHIFKGNQEIASYKISPPGKLIGQDLNRKYEKRIREWVQKYENELLSNWQALRDGKGEKVIRYLPE